MLILNAKGLQIIQTFFSVAGMLMVEVEPESTLMNLYLSKFVDQIIHLYNNGISIIKNGKEFIFRFCINGIYVDTVCRRIMQNRMQFNAYDGCSWCYQLGEYLRIVRGVRYTITQQRSNRTHESHMQDVQSCLENGKVIRGVKGESVLSSLPFIDMVWSFGYEYMHALLGIVRQIWNEWKKAGHLYHLKPEQVKEIEKKFLSVTPTQDIQRLPRPGVLTGQLKRKASEEKFWLLVASLPCLKGILNEAALEHYCLLVKSAYTLLKTEITEDELKQCERDLLQFVVEYEMIYGIERMTFNVHSVLHAPTSIRMTGPLCYGSAFMFESYISVLKKFITGPHGKDYQMVRKHLIALTFKSKNTQSQLSTSVEVEDYCSKLFAPKKLTTFYEKNDEVTFCGRSSLKVNELGDCLLYNKCIYNSTVYHSVAYTRACKTIDNVVQLKSGEFYRIIEILSYNNMNKTSLNEYC